MAIDARSASAKVKRARFAFTIHTSELEATIHVPAAGRSRRMVEIPSFASQSHDWFALDGCRM